jgi:hypothetical protein
MVGEYFGCFSGLVDDHDVEKMAKTHKRDNILPWKCCRHTTPTAVVKLPVIVHASRSSVIETWCEGEGDVVDEWARVTCPDCLRAGVLEHGHARQIKKRMKELGISLPEPDTIQPPKHDCLSPSETAEEWMKWAKQITNAVNELRKEV